MPDTKNLNDMLTCHAPSTGYIYFEIENFMFSHGTSLKDNYC